MKMNSSFNQGFTLIELMITVSVAATLLVLAIPGLSNWLTVNRIATETNSIISSIKIARSEAITRAENIRIEPFTAGTDWSGGWQIVIADSGTVLRTFDAVANSSLTSASATIVFNDDGSLTGTSTVDLNLKANDCPSGKAYQRYIRITLSGIPYLHSDYDCSKTAW